MLLTVDGLSYSLNSFYLKVSEARLTVVPGCIKLTLADRFYYVHQQRKPCDEKAMCFHERVATIVPQYTASNG